MPVGQVGTLRTKEPEFIYIHNGRRKSKQARTPAQDSGLICRPLSNHSYQCYRIQKVLPCQSLVSIIIIDSPMREQGPPKAKQVLGWEVSIARSQVKAAGGADTLARNQTHGRKIPARSRAQSLSKRDSQWFACDSPAQLQFTPPTSRSIPPAPQGSELWAPQNMCGLPEPQIPSKKHGNESIIKADVPPKIPCLAAPVSSALGGPGPHHRISPGVLVSFRCCGGTL